MCDADTGWICCGAFGNTFSVAGETASLICNVGGFVVKKKVDLSIERRESVPFDLRSVYPSEKQPSTAQLVFRSAQSRSATVKTDDEVIR
ncbi:uncharacterized protein MONOS_15851 [Monocercomonoides exilis]|uniref:uncharacterized protein n=1 Tax=Monocercomonoides exilis TaxID=2049356 RepID=UPI003559B14C|nr:hypothetical protein MONOS_15851 [Monocercomonoides exilis]|eukprot:MONOS_15851.1-p1 / transcript=MONOS_15851.1 / gene=MONOS_15851 / organism=Monocercomonoides_exilis_PA203 / gene_product=unspecified product / transcript_product=unspecified product / location=Mono_scaffold01379:1352-1621(+) / protein_length=90 / sequence_SO=supercontig / SO=protein_coding / is_pseudo=false